MWTQQPAAPKFNNETPIAALQSQVQQQQTLSASGQPQRVAKNEFLQVPREVFDATKKTRAAEE